MKKLKILFMGESCIVHTIEHKGSDTFTGTRYNEPALIMKEIIEKQGHEFHHIPCHRVHLDFPNTVEKLLEYDVIVLSDIGSNSLLLHPDTARFCKRTPNKLNMIKEFTEQGGGFIMVGGYMSYMGIDAKAKYKNTVIEDILPVNLLTYDDRAEVPEGADLTMTSDSAYIFKDLPEKWPFILGYNRLIPKELSHVIVEYKGDPIITAGHAGRGRTIAYAADCTPHWAPPEMYEWEYYGNMWNQMLCWVAGKRCSKFYNAGAVQLH